MRLSGRVSFFRRSRGHETHSKKLETPYIVSYKFIEVNKPYSCR
jgi:hypothetical protein